MTDKERLAAMRALGVRWRVGHAIPTYTARMTEAQKREADNHYESLSKQFIDAHGQRRS